jgi:hypothetical protein
MQKIRKAVMDDKSLSSYAHNVKIISQDEKVTLKGPVRRTRKSKTSSESHRTCGRWQRHQSNHNQNSSKENELREYIMANTAWTTATRQVEGGIDAPRR